LYFSVRESDREQAPSVAQLHQNRRLPKIVAGPGSSEQLVGSAAKQDGNLAAHNVELALQQRLRLLSAGLLHNGVLHWSVAQG
jgi:hypothetical protein